jgi:hypothetical protein
MQTKSIQFTHPLSADAIETVIAYARDERSRALRAILLDGCAGLKRAIAALRPSRQKLPLNGRWA